ncbi:MAG: Ig-like domain-containing protein [Patescibacteria group bacterium]
MNILRKSFVGGLIIAIILMAIFIIISVLRVFRDTGISPTTQSTEIVEAAQNIDSDFSTEPENKVTADPAYVAITNKVDAAPTNKVDAAPTSTVASTEEDATVQDTTSPEIVSFIPSPDSTEVSVKTEISILFNEEISPDSITTDSFIVKNVAGPVSGTITYSEKKAVFLPDNYLNYSTDYIVSITNSVKDISNNPFSGINWQFTTELQPEITVNTKLSDFETGTTDDWDEDASIMTPGGNSNYALKLHNSAGFSSATKKLIDNNILTNYSNIELDINTFGNALYDGDGSALAFEQGGEWKMISISEYADGAKTNWQHIKIPLSDFSGLSLNNKVDFIHFRFWNDQEADYAIDNIVLSGKIMSTLMAPTEVLAVPLSANEIRLNWQGNATIFKIYQEDQLIGETNNMEFTVNNLMEDTLYNFHIIATDGVSDPKSSNEVSARTLKNNTSIIADFEDNTNGGWIGDAILTAGFNSSYALRLTNTENDAAAIHKDFNNDFAKGYDKIEFDINLNGATYLEPGSATIGFEQDGWKGVSIMPYIDPTNPSWQHVEIPFSAFTELDTERPIAYVEFRFWDSVSGNFDLDNISLQ